MLRVVAHSQTKTEKVPLEKANPLRHFVWVDAEDPSSKELKEIAEKFNLPKSELMHPLDEHERQRVKQDEKFSLIIASAPSRPKDAAKQTKKHIQPFGFILGKRFIITIHQGVVESVDSLYNEDKHCRYFMGKGKEVFFAALWSSVTDEFHPVLEHLGEQISDIEKEVLHDRGPELVRRISSAKKAVLLMRKAAVGNRDVVMVLMKSVMAKEAKLFEELVVENMQVVDQLDLHRERVASALDIYFTYTSNKMNEVMKSFTVIASLLLFPMFITSFYGMNIALPLQEHSMAWAMLLAVIAVGVFCMSWYFKRKNWL